MKNSLEWPIWKEKLGSPVMEGGIRLSGCLKSSSPTEPLISYITVVRNNENDIERAIRSVQYQTYKNVEHIILDGCSTDSTLEIVQRYANQLDYFASEPDKGLYDALNKGIELCRGELILVLNSDDWLTEESAAEAAEVYLQSQADFIAGAASVFIEKQDKTFLWHPQQVKMNSYFTVPNLNHNAVYASRKAYELSGPYDTSYKIAADSKWVLCCLDCQVKFAYSDEVFVNFSLGGISSDGSWHVEECKRIIKERFPYLLGVEVLSLNYVYYQWRENIHYALDRSQLQQVIEQIRRKYSERHDLLEALDLDSSFLRIIEVERVKRGNSFKLIVQNTLVSRPRLYKMAAFAYKILKRGI